jgi:hypothetical protein
MGESSSENGDGKTRRKRTIETGKRMAATEKIVEETRQTMVVN